LVARVDCSPKGTKDPGATGRIPVAQLVSAHFFAGASPFKAASRCQGATGRIPVAQLVSVHFFAGVSPFKAASRWQSWFFVFRLTVHLRYGPSASHDEFGSDSSASFLRRVSPWFCGPGWRRPKPLCRRRSITKARYDENAKKATSRADEDLTQRSETQTDHGWIR
jgi:hypothetical protein